jgi:hypothetical protein
LGCAIFDSILWYHRDIKVNPTFLGFIKPSGGVNLTPSGFLLSHKKVSGADGATPPGFQFPVKELVACMKDLMGELHKLSFFSIMVKKYLYYEDRI